MSARELVASVLLAVGLVFLLLGAVGLMRFPDVFTRLHPAGKSETVGASLVVLSLAVEAGWSLLAAKIVLVQIFILFSTPAAAHAIGRAAFVARVEPWLGPEEEPR